MNKGVKKIMTKAFAQYGVIIAAIIIAAVAFWYFSQNPNSIPTIPVSPQKPSATLNIAFDSIQICNGKATQLTISGHNADKTATLPLQATINPLQPTVNIVNFYYANQPVTSIDLGTVRPGETTATKVIEVNGTSPIQKSTITININLQSNGQLLDSKSVDFTVSNC